MKFTKIFYWAVFGLICYKGFEYGKEQTYSDVLVYKQLAKAMMKNDDFIIRDVTEPAVTAKIMQSQAKRAGMFKNGKIIFTYYNLKSRQLSADEQSVYLSIDQVSRFNPTGYDTIWGEMEIRQKHDVRLVWKGNEWIIVDFEDPASLLQH